MLVPFVVICVKGNLPSLRKTMRQTDTKLGGVFTRNFQLQCANLGSPSHKYRYKRVFVLAATRKGSEMETTISASRPFDTHAGDFAMTRQPRGSFWRVYVGRGPLLSELRNKTDSSFSKSSLSTEGPHSVLHLEPNTRYPLRNKQKSGSIKKRQNTQEEPAPQNQKKKEGLNQQTGSKVSPHFPCPNPR